MNLKPQEIITVLTAAGFKRGRYVQKDRKKPGDCVSGFKVERLPDGLIVRHIEPRVVYESDKFAQIELLHLLLYTTALTAAGYVCREYEPIFLNDKNLGADKRGIRVSRGLPVGLRNEDYCLFCDDWKWQAHPVHKKQGFTTYQVIDKDGAPREVSAEEFYRIADRDQDGHPLNMRSPMNPGHKMAEDQYRYVTYGILPDNFPVPVVEGDAK